MTTTTTTSKQAGRQAGTTWLAEKKVVFDYANGNEIWNAHTTHTLQRTKANAYYELIFVFGKMKYPLGFF